MVVDRDGAVCFANPAAEALFGRTAGELVDREATHLSRLVRQLFDLARIESGDFALRRAPTDLRRLVEAAVATAERTADGHELAARLPPGPVVADVDAEVVQETVTDLLA